MKNELPFSHLHLRRLHLENRSGYHAATKARRNSPDALTVEYQVKVVAGNDVVFDVSSGFEIPYATRKDHIPDAETASIELFRLLVAQPYAAALRGFLQSKFAELRLADTTCSHAQCPTLAFNDDAVGPALSNKDFPLLSEPAFSDFHLKIKHEPGR